MNENTQSTNDTINTIRKALETESLSVEVIKLPATTDLAAAERNFDLDLDQKISKNERTMTIGDALTDSSGASSFLIQIRPRLKSTSGQAPQSKKIPETVYFPDGKLNTEFLFRNAETLVQSKDYTLARNIYRTVLKSKISSEINSRALLESGKSFDIEGKLEEAKIQYEDSIAYVPRFETYRRLASIFIRQKMNQNAAEVIERALTVKDLSAAARFELHQICAECWMREKRLSDTERHLRKAVDIDPRNEECRTKLGHICLEVGHIQEARRIFHDLIASNAQNSNALTGLAQCYLSEGKKREAHDALVLSLNTNLQNQTAIYQLVKIAYEIKSYATAARFLSEYVQVAPVNSNLLFSLAGLQFHLGRTAEAQATCESVLRIEPEHTGVSDLLKRMGR